MNASQATSPPSAISRMKLRTQLFIASALLSSAILLVAAWVINNQVVTQARQQVQAEVETLLPLYDAIWQEYAQNLATLGTTMSTSPIVKTIVGDRRASRDSSTLREMVADFSQGTVASVDLFIVTDGGGEVTYSEMRGAPFELNKFEAALIVAETQQQHRGFVNLGGRLFQLVLTPVLVHSGSIDAENTLAVLGTGSELNRAKAEEVKRRTHSEVLFLSGNRLYASSFSSLIESQAADAARSASVVRADPAHPAELRLNGEPYLAFTRDLPDSDGESVGQVVVLRSLAGAGRLFQAISNRLLLLWTLSIAAALLLSYLIANRITRPIETLLTSVEAFGKGKDDYLVPSDANGEIGVLARSFDAMRRSLRQTQAALLRSERLATIGQMASSIVHDLRNPLATITTAAEILSIHGRESVGHQRHQSLLESQLRASQRMNAMLAELLEFSRGTYALRLARHSLAEIVGRVTTELKPSVERLDIRIETDVADGFFLKADAERLRRVFENLLQNAIQAMPEGGVVRITAAADPKRANHVRVDIVDSGSGVPLSIRDRIFEPFVSHSKAGGTGLGLAIAHRLVAAHGGELGLETNHTQGSDRGSDFFMTLPLEVETKGGDE